MHGMAYLHRPKCGVILSCLLQNNIQIVDEYKKNRMFSIDFAFFVVVVAFFELNESSCAAGKYCFIITCE